MTDEALHRVHEPGYVAEVERFCEAGGGRLVAGTGANRASYAAARRAAGGAVAAAHHALASPKDDIPSPASA